MKIYNKQNHKLKNSDIFCAITLIKMSLLSNGVKRSLRLRLLFFYFFQCILSLIKPSETYEHIKLKILINHEIKKMFE